MLISCYVLYFSCKFSDCLFSFFFLFILGKAFFYSCKFFTYFFFVLTLDYLTPRLWLFSCTFPSMWYVIKLKLSYAWHHTKKCDDSVIVFRPVALFSASEKAETSPSTHCSCHLFFDLDDFPPSFSWIFFRLHEIFLGRTFPYLFVIRFIKGTITPVFTITGITFTVLKFVENLLKVLPKICMG